MGRENLLFLRPHRGRVDHLDDDMLQDGDIGTNLDSYYAQQDS
jgi:hypothetical protein